MKNNRLYLRIGWFAEDVWLGCERTSVAVVVCSTGASDPDRLLKQTKRRKVKSIHSIGQEEEEEVDREELLLPPCWHKKNGNEVAERCWTVQLDTFSPVGRHLGIQGRRQRFVLGCGYWLSE